MNKLNFGDAVKALKDGKKIQRQGWNGKGMYLYYVPANAYPPVTEIGATLKNENGLVPYDAYIAMKTVQNTVIPWQPSQADVLAEDWQVVE